MSEEISGNACSGRLVMPFCILALSFAIMLGSLYKDALRVKSALETQIQLQGKEGERVAMIRTHYYSLYRDLVSLAQRDATAAAIVQKYGIQVNQPGARAQ
jgi:hypothetical protein